MLGGGSVSGGLAASETAPGSRPPSSRGGSEGRTGGCRALRRPRASRAAGASVLASGPQGQGRAGLVLHPGSGGGSRRSTAVRRAETGCPGDAPVTPHGTSRTPFPCQWAGGPAEPWAWPHGRPRLPSGQPRALGTVFQNRPVGTENQAAEADTLCTASSVPGRFQHWLFLSKSDCIFEEGTMAVCAGGLHRPSVAMATPTPGTPALSGAGVWAGGSGV